MDLQTTFYALGIVFMIFVSAFLIAIIIFIVAIKNKMEEIQKNIQDKVDQFSTVEKAGSTVAGIIAKKAKEYADSKNKKSSD